MKKSFVRQAGLGQRISAVVAFSTLILGNGAIAADSSGSVSALAARADQSYQSGDCKKALSDYSAILSRSDVDGAVKNLALFRSSYCHLTLGDSTSAESGFKNYLSRDPSNGEARAKLAQSIFAQGRYAEVKGAVQPIPATHAYYTEALILSARAHIEMHEPRAALLELNSAKTSDDWRPVVQYWKAVALYHLDEDSKAEQLFTSARNVSPANHWVKTEAQGWLDSMMAESQRFHVQVTGGAYYDGNVAQSLTRSVSGGGGSGGPGNGPGVSLQTGSASAAIQDRGYSTTAEFSFTPYHSRAFNLQMAIDASATFYSAQTSYNYETLTAKLDGAYQFSSEFQGGASVSYMNSRYAYAYYQDYLISTPYLNWSVSRDLWIGASVPLTTHMVTRPSFNFAPALNARYGIESWLSVFGGASFTSANGQAATYTSTAPPSVASGTAFSRYTSLGGYAGVGLSLPWSLDLSAQYSIYSTAYAAEAVTLPGGGSTSRSDALSTLQFTLARPIIPRIWSLGLSVSSATNSSTGFQGVSSGGSVPDNNYSRIYAALSTTISY